MGCGASTSSESGPASKVDDSGGNATTAPPEAKEVVVAAVAPPAPVPAAAGGGSGTTCPSESLASDDALRGWLVTHGADAAQVTTWGTPGTGTKPLSKLRKEALTNDSELVIGPDGAALRVVSVLNVRIFSQDGQRELYNSHQTLPDGTTKQRDRLLAEKRMAGEDVAGAGVRGVREELLEPLRLKKVVNEDVRVEVVPGSELEEVSARTKSDAYPGLQCRYVVHTVTAKVGDGTPEGGLPQVDFTTDEKEDDSDSIKVTHHWGWVPRKP